ncbi:hypothetical protein EON63_01595 [archaeon]|nr:MAG: hypothetical protein EON63_01595 [archaeon]
MLADTNDASTFSAYHTHHNTHYPYLYVTTGIINFAKFREERRLAMQEVNAQREELVEKLAQVQCIYRV